MYRTHLLKYIQVQSHSRHGIIEKMKTVLWYRKAKNKIHQWNYWKIKKCALIKKTNKNPPINISDHVEALSCMKTWRSRSRLILHLSWKLWSTQIYVILYVSNVLTILKHSGNWWKQNILLNIIFFFKTDWLKVLNVRSGKKKYTPPLDGI